MLQKTAAFFIFITMGLSENFKANWKKQFPYLPTADCKLLLAVSGGIDSIVLTDLIYKCGFNFTIAHCNFQLRGEESERDEMFVRSLKEKYSKEVLVKKFDTEKYAAEKKMSIQEAARNLRYAWFKEIVNDQCLPVAHTGATPKKEAPGVHHPSLCIHLIATAHHANDNIETLLFHFFRGTGIRGLAAIPEFDKERKIIRPLLFAKRSEIELYAKENGLNWVEDSSNATDKYTRNFFRLNLIPAIKELFPDVEENLLHNIERFKEAGILYQQAIEQHKKKLAEQKGNELHIPILKLKKSEPLHSVIWEIIKGFNFTTAQADEVKKIFDADNGSYISSSSHRVIKNRNWLIIAPLQTEAAQNILIEEGEKKIIFENGELIFEPLRASNLKPQTSNLVASLDAAEIKFPLLLRKWKQGDYFYPLGMTKKKKLSRFFIDLKLSKPEKEKVWVLEVNKKIIWVIGYRIDERFKITASTRKILRISFAEKSEK